MFGALKGVDHLAEGGIVFVTLDGGPCHGFADLPDPDLDGAVVFEEGSDPQADGVLGGVGGLRWHGDNGVFGRRIVEDGVEGFGRELGVGTKDGNRAIDLGSKERAIAGFEVGVVTKEVGPEIGVDAEVKLVAGVGGECDEGVETVLDEEF